MLLLSNSNPTPLEHQEHHRHHHNHLYQRPTDLIWWFISYITNNQNIYSLPRFRKIFNTRACKKLMYWNANSTLVVKASIAYRLIVQARYYAYIYMRSNKIEVEGKSRCRGQSKYDPCCRICRNHLVLIIIIIIINWKCSLFISILSHFIVVCCAYT